MHGFIQVLVQARSPFWHLLFVRIKNKPPLGQTLLMPIHARCFQECKGTPSRLLGNQWYKNYALLHTNVCALVPVVIFYDTKPQLVKTPVEGKPSTISLNHTCQCSLLIISYNTSPSHFSAAHYLQAKSNKCSFIPFKKYWKNYQELD